MKQLTFILCLLLGYYAQAQETIRISLEQAIELAMVNHPGFQNAQLDVESAQHRVKEILSAGLPQVNGNAGFTHNVEIATTVMPDFITPSIYQVLLNEEVLDKNKTTVPDITSAEVKFGIPYNLQAGVSLRQLVFDGTYFLGMKAASEFVRISELMASMSQVDVKEGVTKAYYMALISTENLGQMEKSLVNLKTVKEETEALYTEGFVEKLDVDRLNLSISNLEIQINNLRMQTELSRKVLLNSIGLDVNQQVELSSVLPEFNTTNFDPSYGLDLNADQRIEIQLMEQQQVLNQLDLRRWKIGYIPNLYLNANYGLTSFAGDGRFSDLGKDWFPVASYGFSLNVPIFDGLYKKAKADQVRVKILQTANDFKALRNGIALEISKARSEYVNAYSNLQLQEKNMQLAQDIYTSTSIKFKEGVGSSFEMVQSETDLNNARTSYLNALYQLNISKLGLQKALGQI